MTPRPVPTSDLDIARAMLDEAQACSHDFDADAEFERLSGAASESSAHRRRLNALRELWRLGEAERCWTGIWCPPAGAPNRALIYRKVKR